MALASTVNIANAALARIGADPVQDFNDDDDEGRAAGFAYERVVEFNFGIYPFSFAKEIRQLSVNSAATPLSGFTYVYDLPPERLGQPIYITDDVTDPDRRFSKFALVGSEVHASPDALFAMIRFLPAPNLWSPTFKSATISALCADFALSIAHDKSLADQMHRLAYGTSSENYRGGELGAAMRADAYSTPPRGANWGRNNPFYNAHTREEA
jgi:hypothetical protein